jgi:hypothetical protein
MLFDSSYSSMGYGCSVHTAPESVFRAYNSNLEVAVGNSVLWRISMPFAGDGPTVGTFTNIGGNAFSVDTQGSCVSRGLFTQVSDVTITRADKDSFGQLTALDLTFEHRCRPDESPLVGRIRYRPFLPAQVGPCTTPTVGPAVLYDQRMIANPNVPIACFAFTPKPGGAGGTGYGTESRIVFVEGEFYTGFAGIVPKNGVRLAVGTFPISTTPTAPGVQVFGPCVYASSGSATITAIKRDAAQVITDLDFTFSCTTPDGFFRGVEFLPYT